MAGKKESTGKNQLILLGILLVFLAIIDISTLIIWKFSIQPASPPEGGLESATVVEITDANSFKLDNGETVRLLGMDASSQGGKYYDEAKNMLSILVLNNKVRLEKDVTDKDNQGRLLRYVFVDYSGEELFVNKEAVRQGYALSYFLEPNVKYRTEIEAARQACLQEQIRLCGN